MANKPIPVPEEMKVPVENRPTSPPPPRKTRVADEDASPSYWVGYYRKQSEYQQQDIEKLNGQNAALIDALKGVWCYATTGAQVTDVNTHEQHQFVTARKLITQITGEVLH